MCIMTKTGANPRPLLGTNQDDSRPNRMSWASKYDRVRSRRPARQGIRKWRSQKSMSGYSMRGD